uniref:UBC core domain-containing protein n=1 Tax=Oncorhynchus kisutch TaxID=8019 RepID=A0A8C7IZM3_ONCKI
MHTHAHFLLRNQYLKLQTANLKGVEAKPVSHSLLEWEAKVEGLKDTLWEGAVLLLTLHFTESYNSVPPTVEFNAIPFHPNVDKDTGSPCLPCLDSEWNPSISISSILLSIQVGTMLSNPVLEGAVNPEAADMLWSSPSTYHRVVLESPPSTRISYWLHWATLQSYTVKKKVLLYNCNRIVSLLNKNVVDPTRNKKFACENVVEQKYMQ